MTSSDHFAITLTVITLATGLLAWLLRYVFASVAEATRDNTRAIRELDKTLGKLTARMVRVETILDAPQTPGNHRTRH